MKPSWDLTLDNRFVQVTAISFGPPDQIWEGIVYETCPTLEQLPRFIAPTGVGHLAYVTSLRCLVLSLEDKDLHRICESMPKLRTLEVVIANGSVSMDFLWLSPLSKLLDLEHLSLRLLGHRERRGIDVHFFYAVETFPKLLTLDINRIDSGFMHQSRLGFTPSIYAVSRNVIFPNLQELVFWLDRYVPVNVEDLARQLNVILPDTCRVKFRYFRGQCDVEDSRLYSPVIVTDWVERLEVRIENLRRSARCKVEQLPTWGEWIRDVSSASTQSEEVVSWADSRLEDCELLSPEAPEVSQEDD